MRKLFGWDSPIMQFLNHVADLVILSLLWLICSLPVVTMGAATTALYGVVLKEPLGESGPIAGTFLRKFKENFKQATVLWLLSLPLLALTVAEVFLGLSGAVGDSAALLAACLLPAVLLAAVLSFLFPLVSYFELTNRQALKNAALLCLAKLPQALAVTAINVVPLVVLLFVPIQMFTGILTTLLVGPGIQAKLNSLLLLRVFKCITGEEKAEETEGSE